MGEGLASEKRKFNGQNLSRVSDQVLKLKLPIQKIVDESSAEIAPAKLSRWLRAILFLF